MNMSGQSWRRASAVAASTSADRLETTTLAAEVAEIIAQVRWRRRRAQYSADALTSPPP